MNTQARPGRWVVGALVAVALIAVAAGAYNLGLSHAVAISTQVPGGAVAGATPGVPVVIYPYGWHRPWGFGFVFPLLFLGFWFLVARTFFWGGGWRRYGAGC